MLKEVRRFVKLLERSVKVPRQFAAAGISQEGFETIKNEILAAYRDAPRIAVIGETGVGKSTTLNALFNAGQEVSHTRACTQIETELRVKEGALRVFDMPGLGEDIERDRVHIETYRRVLPGCDVALWIVKADARAIAHVQRCLRDLVDAKALDSRRLVIGINQVDLLQPGTWKRRYNMPDSEQETSILARVADVREKISKVVDLPEDRIVWYSALKSYRLGELLHGLERACDRSRMWLIQDRAHFLDFDDLAEVSNA